MRKYLIAGLVGVALIAGQAAAADSYVTNYGDRVGSDTSSWTSTDTLAAVLLGGTAIGLVAWGLSDNGNGGSPASP